jgi:hypothetical protein
MLGKIVYTSMWGQRFTRAVSCASGVQVSDSTVTENGCVGQTAVRLVDQLIKICGCHCSDNAHCGFVVMVSAEFCGRSLS